MSINFTAYGVGTMWSFADTSYEGPDWWSLPIDATSSSSQITSTFTFEGFHVVVTINGAFGANPASLATLSGLANQIITGYSVELNGAKLYAIEYSTGLTFTDAMAIEYATNASELERLYSGNDTFVGSLQSNSDGDTDTVNGYGGNDVFQGNAAATGSYHDEFYGGDGIDTAVFRGNLADYSLSASFLGMSDNIYGQGYQVTDHVASRDGTVDLLSVERLQFADTKLAIDNEAIQTMEFIGLVAPSLLNNLNVRGAILNLFDSGKSLEQLCQLALDAGLLPSASNADLANVVFQNVVGAAASTEMTNALVTYISEHGQANFLATVAEMHINVDIVGLAQTGVEYA